MAETLESLKAELALRRPKSNNQGFPPKLRRRVAAYARAQISTEVTTSALASQLGISRHSLCAWLREKPPPRRADPTPPSARTFLPVQLIPDPVLEPSAKLVLTSPRGCIVAGLDLSALAELLERLG
jgi:hypothetical protein